LRYAVVEVSLKMSVAPKNVTAFSDAVLLSKNRRAQRDAVWQYAKPFPTVSIAGMQKAGPRWATPLPYAPDYRVTTLEEKFLQIAGGLGFRV
jgi:hypothetical protein